MPGGIPEPRPLLKRASGKRQLLPQLRDFFPQTFGRCDEPFVGSGAVFFDLWNQQRLADRCATLTDENSDLIGTYLRVRDSVDAILEALDELTREHARRGRDHYFEGRDRRFNPARRRWREGGGTAATYPYGTRRNAALSESHRLQRTLPTQLDGDFNVPPGRYADPRVDGGRIRAVSRVLPSETVTLAEARFESAVCDARAGDFVYFDPPYAPLTETANFRSYTARGFTHDDQRRLRDLVVDLTNRKVSVLLSNSTAPSVIDLDEGDSTVHAAGLKCNGRGVVQELLVTNVLTTPSAANLSESAGSATLS